MPIGMFRSEEGWVQVDYSWQHPASIEDNLQEFGRAGRDGKASVAVLLHDRSNAKRDIGLLQFMANRAVGNAQLSAAAAQGSVGPQSPTNR